MLYHTAMFAPMTSFETVAPTWDGWTTTDAAVRGDRGCDLSITCGIPAIVPVLPWHPARAANKSEAHTHARFMSPLYPLRPRLVNVAIELYDALISEEVETPAIPTTASEVE
jgi:hypothetical protein